MIRRTTLAWVVLAILVGTGLFLVKNEVHDLEARLGRANHEILENQQAIHVLHAEWSYLNQPARLDDLGRRLLGLRPRDGARIIPVDELARPSSPPVRRDIRAAAASPPRAAVLPPEPRADNQTQSGWLKVLLAGLEARR